MSDIPQAYVLVGPTASGKSAVAQLLAEQIGVPIVSADSMNIYRGMDIGTAKPSPAERAKVKTWGVDLAEPMETFSVGDWLNAVRPAFQSLPLPSVVAAHSCGLARFARVENQTGGGSASPIVVGGTGLYVKCLLQGLDDLPTADEALRERAEKMPLAELQAEALRAAPEAYEALADKENPRRLIRLLEKFPMSGNVDAVSSPRFSNLWKSRLPTVIGLSVERDELHRRIAERVEKMYAGGLLEEARGLIRLKLSSTAQHAIGYAEVFAVLRGEMTEAAAKEKTIIRTRQLSKRQMTWFRHQLNVEWIKTSSCSTVEKLAMEVSERWRNGSASAVKGV